MRRGTPGPVTGDNGPTTLVIAPSRATNPATRAPATGRWRQRARSLSRAPFAAQTWRANLYTLVGAVLALPGFLLVVVSTVFGLGLAVTFLGLPLLVVGGMLAVRLGRLHRALATTLLGRTVPAARPRPAGRGFFGWLQARLADPIAWRARLYLVVKLPVAWVAFYAAD